MYSTHGPCGIDRGGGGGREVGEVGEEGEGEGGGREC